MVMKRIKPPFKYYGGKFYLAGWIVSHIPSHHIYIEPFGGAASVLLNKPRSQKEIYNDLNPDISNLMRYIRDEHNRLVNTLRTIRCEETVYYEWKNKICTDPFDSAVRSFVLHRMSRGGTATTFSKSNRVYRGLPENVAAWETGVNNLLVISNRLQGVEIRNENGLDLIHEFDSPDAVFYLDPPYVASSRKNKAVYKMEMDDSNHQNLADLCKKSASRILLSGYNSDLYTKLFPDWTCEKKTGYLHGGHSQKKQLRDELLWKNF